MPPPLKSRPRQTGPRQRAAASSARDKMDLARTILILSDVVWTGAAGVNQALYGDGAAGIADGVERAAYLHAQLAWCQEMLLRLETAGLVESNTTLAQVPVWGLTPDGSIERINLRRASVAGLERSCPRKQEDGDALC